MSWIQLPTVTSPMFKQVFDLRSGRCLDDPDVTVPAYGVEVIDGQVVVTIGGGDQAGSGDE
jgi:nitrite reductase (NADH) small subunit